MKKGFTLVEVLFAVVIFFVTLLGLFAAVTFSQRESLSGLEREGATSLLRKKLEHFLASNYGSIMLPNCPSGKSNRQSYLKRECRRNLNSGSDLEFKVIRNINFHYATSSCMVEDVTLGIKSVYLDICWKDRGKINHLMGFTIVRKEP